MLFFFFCYHEYSSSLLLLLVHHIMINPFGIRHQIDETSTMWNLILNYWNPSCIFKEHFLNLAVEGNWVKNISTGFSQMLDQSWIESIRKQISHYNRNRKKAKIKQLKIVRNMVNIIDDSEVENKFSLMKKLCIMEIY